MRIVCTADWSYEQLAPYTKAITAHFRKLAERFPDDLTLESIGHECVMGAKQLWLALDGEKLVAVALTRTSVVDATGLKIVTMSDLAGDEGQSFQEELGSTVEAWAKKQGADYTAIEGRPGWSRVMKKRGYREYARLWRKRID